MQSEITLWGIAIPSVVATAISSLVMWYLNHQSMKEIKALESRLRREEEAFRLLHSPRVSTAVKLWSAFCDFETCVRFAVSPASLIAKPKGADLGRATEGIPANAGAGLCTAN